MEKIILQNHIVTYALDAKILSMYETKCCNTNNEKEFDIFFSYQPCWCINFSFHRHDVFVLSKVN